MATQAANRAEAFSPNAIQILGIFLAGGVGGLMPTLVKMAPVYSQIDSPPLPAAGFYLGLGIFFVIGAIVAVASKERDFGKAILLGIAAPGIVTNFLAGKAEGTQNATPVAAREVDANQIFSAMLGAGPAHAQTTSSAHSTTLTAAPQLKVVPHVSGSRVSLRPLKLEFISADGAVLATRNVDARYETVVDVPFGASLVRTSSDGKSTDAQLPARPYSDADLTLGVSVAKGNDLMWAFGAPRKAKVESLFAKLGNVRNRDALVNAFRYDGSVPGRSLEGSRVITTTGQQVGVIQSVSKQPGEPATVVLRPQ